MRLRDLQSRSPINETAGSSGLGTLYHGGRTHIDTFIIPAHGVYFSPHREWAEHYGSAITVANVHADKVYKIDYTNKIDEQIIDALFDRDYPTVAKFIRILQDKGYQAMQTVSDSEMVVVFPGTRITVLGKQTKNETQ